MSKFDRVYTQCSNCGRDLHYGNAVLEIERNIEQHDYEEETGQHVVTVIDADPLVTLCAHCGNSMAHRKELWKLLVAELGLPGPATDEDAAQQIEAGQLETCSCCGIELLVGRARVALIRLIGQMDWSDQRDDGELLVINAEDILSFCPSCGNKMSSQRLRQSLHRIIDDLGVPERLEASIGMKQQELRGTPEHPVKILHIAAEGGEITLYGWRDDNGEWQFRQETNETSLYSEDTADLPLHQTSDITPGWHGALELLSRHPWYRLAPVYVHPEFAEQTMEGLRNAPEKHQPNIDYQKWQAVCDGNDPWKVR